MPLRRLLFPCLSALFFMASLSLQAQMGNQPEAAPYDPMAPAAPQQETAPAPQPVNPDEIYSISSIAVDVTAASAAAARDKAIFDGQRAALVQLLDRIEAGKGVDPAKLSDNKIAALVKNFEIVSEKSSSVRYIATMNVRFKPRAVQALLQNAGVHFTASPTLPVIILPISTSSGRPVLWEEHTAWRNAVERLDRQDNLRPVIVPNGELNDVGAIDANAALTGNSTAIAAIAAQHGAGSVIVAAIAADIEKIASNQPLPLTLTRFDNSGQRQDSRTVTVPAATTTDTQLAAAAQEIQDFIKHQSTEATGNSAAIQSASQSILSTASLQLYAPLGSLPELTRLKQRLSAVTTIQKINIRTIRRDGAELGLEYTGDIGQLQQGLTAQGLSLNQTASGQWQIVSN